MGMFDWREKRLLSPVSVLLLALLFIVLVQGVVVYFVTSQPWTGVRLQPDVASGFVRVVSVTENSPAAGKIQPGQVLVGIRQGKETVPLLALAKVESSDIANRSVHDEFIALQGRLHGVIQPSGVIRFVTLEGAEIAVIPASGTPFTAISGAFWFLLMIGVVGMVSGVMAWTYRPEVLGARLLLGAAFSSFLLQSAFAAMAAREIALPTASMVWLTLAELVFTHVYVIFLFFILSSYPNRLLPDKVLGVYVGINVLLVTAYYFRWFDIPIHQFYFPFIPPFLIGSGLSYWQWKLTRQKPLERAAVLVMQFSIIVSSGLAILLYVLPLMLQQQTVIDAVSMRSVQISLFIGCAIGILRFRLFELEYWWFKSWLWLLGGVAVLLLDITLIGLLQISQVYALGLSVVLAGFLYFPLRQWLLGKVMPLGTQSLPHFLPRFSTAMADAASPAEFEQGWQAALQARFAPLNLAKQVADVQKPQLSENGLHLWVPGLAKGSAYQLSGK
ncbi:MAG: hypothetical protein WBM66_15130, partial [Thiothrix litoralis]